MIKKIEYIYYIYFVCLLPWVLLESSVNLDQIPFFMLGLASTYLRFSKKRVLIGNIGLFATIFLILFYRYWFGGPPPIDFPIGLALCLFACFHGASTNDEVTTKKEFLPVFLLCFLFGYVGVHRFYAGKTVSGILMVATLGGLGFWYIIDLILLLTGNFTDSDGRVIKYNSSSAAKSLSVADELEKFADLRAKGILTEEEFQSKKMALLDS
jgi:TM2 domain-containing membrane protein YozV